jgi:hypothetical protein
MPSKRYFDKLPLAWREQKHELVPSHEQNHPSDTTSDASDEDGETQITFPTWRAWRKKFWIFIPILAGLSLMTIAAAIFVAYKYATLDELHRLPITQCGTNSREARELGCVFEITLSLWVPPDCYDAELEALYTHEEGLKYYHDINLTRQASLAEVRSGESPSWFVPWEHHVRHCAFAVRKLHRAAASGRKIDGYVLQYAHTQHCIKMFTDPEPSRVKATQVDIAMYPFCGKEGGYNLDHMHPYTWT